MTLISVSRFLAAESDLSVGAHINAEIDILGLDALNRRLSPPPPAPKKAPPVATHSSLSEYQSTPTHPLINPHPIISKP